MAKKSFKLKEFQSKVFSSPIQNIYENREFKYSHASLSPGKDYKKVTFKEYKNLVNEAEEKYKDEYIVVEPSDIVNLNNPYLGARGPRKRDVEGKFIKKENITDEELIIRPGDLIISASVRSLKFFLFNENVISKMKRDKNKLGLYPGSYVFLLRTEKNEYINEYLNIEKHYRDIELAFQKKAAGRVVQLLQRSGLLEIEFKDLTLKDLRKMQRDENRDLLEENVLKKSLKPLNNKIQRDFFTELLDEYFADPIIKLSKKEESQTLEFKSSFQTAVENKAKPDTLKNEVLKTIVAFCNSGGGDLLIGVQEKTGTIHGIEVDGFDNRDKFERHVANVISSKIIPNPFMKLDGIIFSYCELEGKTICRIQVENATDITFLKEKQEINGQMQEVEVLYQRVAAMSKALKGSEQAKFIEEKLNYMNN